jgi:hypothetical protein
LKIIKLLSCCLNGVTLGLIDAGIPLLYTPCSVDLSLPKNNLVSSSIENSVHLWPENEVEKKDNVTTFTLSFPNNNFDNLLLMVMDGNAVGSEVFIDEIVKIGKHGGLQFLKFVKETFKQKFDVLINK